ncbi:MAG TPA: endopeptidase La [Capsulimonadaceae bacterium]|jgi:ATP-dependent Lon protease
MTDINETKNLTANEPDEAVEDTPATSPTPVAALVDTGSEVRAIADPLNGEGAVNGDADHSLTIPGELAILPLRDMVVFPVLVSPIAVSRESSVQLVDEAVGAGNRIIGVVSMPDPSVEKPTSKDITSIGTAVIIRMMAKGQDGVKMIVQGLVRIQIQQILQEEPYLKARIKVLDDVIPEGDDVSVELEALRRQISTVFQRTVALSPNMPDELTSLTTAIESPSHMTDLVAAHLNVPPAEKQKILEIINLPERMKALLEVLSREVQVLELGTKLQSQVSTEINKTQRDYYLREQMKAIQKELGEGEDRGAEVDELRLKVSTAGLTEEAFKEATRELDRLARMSPGSPEYTVARSYIDWLIALPWETSTPDNLDIKEVKAVLDADHFGLDKVKDRILEYLAVRKFKAAGDLRQPILCLVGPPGVGKTSLGRSVARAMGKKFVRLSLGGIRDEAEIRGHRRTYIGALPGQIIQGLKRAGTNNPLFILDEIDKVTSDFRGDPSSALLEVLDPEQNSTFRDNYLDVTFDLSKVLFMTTANMLDTIQPALRDRMEIIELSGYTEEEKTEIAKRHLIPKQLSEHGLTTEKVTWIDDGVRAVIRGHTREAGVRNLEREIASVTRKATREFAEGRENPIVINAAQVEKYLGAPRFEYEEVKERGSIPGVATGLVWTPVGGDVVFIEASKMEGGKSLQLTGQLGDVMRESAHAALSYLRAHATELGIPADFYSKSDLHIHVPAGAIPKDGPSAGVTMASAIASLVTGRAIKPLLAMTGEITLSGKVLPVGGIKEKVLAARRAGIRTVILPARNRKDLEEDIPEELRRDMTFIYASDITDVLENALVDAPLSKKALKNGASKNGHAHGHKKGHEPLPVPVTKPASGGLSQPVGNAKRGG